MGKSLSDVIANVEKQFGQGYVRAMNEYVVIPKTSSGSIGLDLALGGGYPKGRVIEIYGPESSGKTTTAIHAAIEIQKEGKIVVYIDYENAMDPEYCENVGLDLSPDKFRLVNPDTTEDGLELIRQLLGVNEIGLIIVDSVAAMVPKAELIGDFGDSKMGLQARAMSQGLRMLIKEIKSTNCTIMFINQTRDKLGVMFGCFDYSSRVKFADGTSERIGKIVNQKIDKPVLSMNSKGEVVESRIINWFNNGVIEEEWLKFVVDKGCDNGRSQFKVTPNHLIFTERGEIPAGELRVGDTVKRLENHLLNDDQKQIVLGSMLGDGHMKVSQRQQITQKVGNGVVRNIEKVVPILPSQRRKFDLQIADTNCYCVDGVFVHNSPETTTGGNALKFYASQRLRISKSGGEKDKEGEMTAILSKIEVKKNKVAPPFRKCEIPIRFGTGFDKEREVLDIAVDLGIVKKSGSWFSYGDTKLGQGADNVRLVIEDNPGLFEELDHKVRVSLGFIEE